MGTNVSAEACSEPSLNSGDHCSFIDGAGGTCFERIELFKLAKLDDDNMLEKEGIPRCSAGEESLHRGRTCNCEVGPY